MTLAAPRLELSSPSSLHALAELKKQGDKYDSQVLDALSAYVKEERNQECREIELWEATEGMVLAQDIKNQSGTLVMSKGQEVTRSAQRMLENVSNNGSVVGPIRVVVSREAAACLV